MIKLDLMCWVAILEWARDQDKLYTVIYMGLNINIQMYLYLVDSEQV